MSQYTITKMLYPERTYCKVDITNRSGVNRECFISKGRQELTVGQVLKGTVKERSSPQFKGGFHNRPRALFKKELEVVGLSHAKREALFKTFTSQKLFKLLGTDKVAPIQNVEGIGIETLKSIRAAFKTFKPVLEDNKSFGHDYPKLYKYVTENPKIRAAIIERYKSFYIFSQAIKDPFAIVLNDRFLRFPGPTSDEFEEFERSVKLHSRKRIAELAAQDRKIPPNDPSYVRYSLICDLYKEIKSSGDTWVPRSTLPKVIPDLPIVERDGMVTLAFFDDLEHCFAEEMEKTIARHKKARDHRTMSESQQKAIMSLDDVQCGAVRMTRDNAISILLGGAGTGKTTTSAAIVLGGNWTLAAPTGKAANRLKEVTGEPAFTVHKHYYSKVELSDKVLCDEMSMQGMVILTRLLMKGRFSKIVFVGDPGQLQSINPGQALKDLLLADVPSTTLTKIYRTGPNSTIARNGERIYKGDADLQESKSFELRTFKDYEDLVKEAVQIFQDTGTVPRILVNTNEEAAEINNLLRDKVNPAAVGRSETAKLSFRWQSSRKRHLYCGYAYREGDLVMCTDNTYEETDNGGKELVAANGQVGKITKATTSSVQVSFSQSVLFKSKTAIEKLVPAYAGTVHKAQGSEFDHVIVKASFQSWKQKHREWLYTAITRAQKKCIVFETKTGDCSSCIKQVPTARKTFLADRIRYLFTSKRKRESEPAFRALCKED